MIYVMFRTHKIKLENKNNLSEIKIILKRYHSLREYILSNYYSVNGLLYLSYPRRLRDEWLKSRFYTQFKLPSRYWKLGLDDSFKDIKNNWRIVFSRIRSNIKNRGLNKNETHYINYVLKSPKLLFNILKNRSYVIPESQKDNFTEVSQNKLNQLLKRIVRKYLKKPSVKKVTT